MEKQVKSETIYDGRVVKLIKDEVELDDGTKGIREIVLHNGGCCIALKGKDDKFYMVKQYRYALGRDMLEFCAGKLEKGENPDEAILREASEELGFTVKNLKKLGVIVPTCGYSSELIHLYYGEEDETVGVNFDEDERIEPLKFTKEEIEEMIKDHKIQDAKTMACLYYMNLMGVK